MWGRTVTAVGLEVVFNRPNLAVSQLIAEAYQVQAFVPVLLAGFFLWSHVWKKSKAEFRSFASRDCSRSIVVVSKRLKSQLAGIQDVVGVEGLFELAGDLMAFSHFPGE